MEEQVMERRRAVRSSYSHQTAWSLSRLSKLVYEGEEAVQAALAGETPSRTAVFFGFDGLRGMLVEGPDYAALIFRGTESGGVILKDMQASLVEIGGKARVNSEFYSAFKRVEGDVLALVSGSSKPLFVAGHSLGGALAVLASHRISREMPDKLLACYTFGCPRLGDTRFFRSLRGTAIYHVVHGLDLVPHMPPKMITRYSDAENLRHVFRNKNGAIAFAMGWARRMRILLGLVGVLGAVVYLLVRARLVRDLLEPFGTSARLRPLAEDHRIAHYTETLAALAAEEDPSEPTPDKVSEVEQLPA